MKQCIAGWENIKSLFSSGIWEGRGKRPHWKTSAVFKNGPDGLNVWGLTPRGHRGLYVYVCVQPCVCMCSFSVVIRECVYAPGFKLQLITSSLTHTHTRVPEAGSLCSATWQGLFCPKASWMRYRMYIPNVILQSSEFAVLRGFYAYIQGWTSEGPSLDTAKNQPPSFSLQSLV